MWTKSEDDRWTLPGLEPELGEGAPALERARFQVVHVMFKWSCSSNVVSTPPRTARIKERGRAGAAV